MLDGSTQGNIDIQSKPVIFAIDAKSILDQEYIKVEALHFLQLIYWNFG